MQEFLEIANILADEAGKIIRQYYRQPVDVQSKSDSSPVTIADREVEQRLREIIEKRRPQDGILGEEFGPQESRSGLTWVLDPIDGTKSFVIGRPTFGTLIALAEGDIPVMGIIDQPVLKERWIGAQDRATTFNGAPVRVSSCARLSAARAASTTPAMFDLRHTHIYHALEKETKMLAWGGDCYAYGLLASGHCDLIVEAALSPYDFAALVPIVEGAGGFIKDWEGNSLTLKSDGRVIAASDSDLLNACRKFVN